MTVIDALPTLTRKKVKDLIPGDVIVHQIGGRNMHDMVTSVRPMPLDFGLEYGNLYVQLDVTRSVTVLTRTHFQEITFTVSPHSWYHVLTETGKR